MFTSTKTIASVLALWASSSASLAEACPLTNCPAKASPILSQPDLNGDGRVDTHDLQIISDSINGEYTAIFDLNADGALDAKDKKVVQDILISGNHVESTRLDRQLLRLYHDTKHLRSVQSARNEVFVQVSHDAAGRGTEFMSSPMELRKGRDADSYQSYINPTFVADKPDGLLFHGQSGDLLACEFNLQPDVAAYVKQAEKEGNGDLFSQWPEALSLGLVHARERKLAVVESMPSFFASDEAKWRSRLGVCFANFALGPTFDGHDLDILQQKEYTTLVECSNMASSGEMTYLPALSSLTVWVHSLNRCGVFAQCNPDVAPNAKSVGDVAPSHADASECQWMKKMDDELTMFEGSEHATPKGKVMIEESKVILRAERNKAC